MGFVGRKLAFVLVDRKLAPYFASLLSLIIRVVLIVLRGGPKSLPAFSYNALIIPILRIVCTISVFYVFSVLCL